MKPRIKEHAHQAFKTNAQIINNTTQAHKSVYKHQGTVAHDSLKTIRQLCIKVHKTTQRHKIVHKNTKKKKHAKVHTNTKVQA